jgi:hypothetical protein
MPFPYSLEHVNAISEQLGIPWESSKDQPFGPFFIYLEFFWDINNKTVTLTEHNQQKYCRALEEWNQASKHSLVKTEKLHGKLLHATHVILAGHA